MTNSVYCATLLWPYEVRLGVLMATSCFVPDTNDRFIKYKLVSWFLFGFVSEERKRCCRIKSFTHLKLETVNLLGVKSFLVGVLTVLFYLKA